MLNCNPAVRLNPFTTQYPESQNFLDPGLAKPQSLVKSRVKIYRSRLNIIE